MRMFWTKMRWSLALMLGLCVLCMQVSAKESKLWRVYVGGYTTADSFGINCYLYDSDIGLLSPQGLAVPTENPSYLVANEEGTFLYCVNETASFEGSGTVSAFSIEQEFGKLTEIAKQSTEGTYPCHLALGKKGKRLVVANYGSGSIVVFPIDRKTGEVGARTGFFQYTGSSVNKTRQAGPHAHCVAFDPDYRYLYCCDLGSDKVYAYESSRVGIPLTASSSPFVNAEPGSGPRQIAFHPTHPSYMYVVNELSNSVTLYEAAFDNKMLKLVTKRENRPDGKLELVGSWSTLPAGFEGSNRAAAIKIHPNGKFLYVSNRGDDSIAIFSINTETGKLNPIGFVPTGGKTPRDIAIHPDGKSLVVANQDSDTLTTFIVNPATGELTPSGQEPVANVKPSCVVFVSYKVNKR